MKLEPRPVSDAARCAAFLRSLEDRSAHRTEAWSLGTALFHPSFPVKWDLNFLRLERDDTTLSAEEVAAEAHRIHSEAGLKHRKISVEDAVAGARLAQGFRRLDWNVTRLVTMTLQGPPPAHGPVDVKEVSLDDVRDAWIALDMNERQMSRSEAEMLWRSMKEVTGSITDLRIFAGFLEGEIAGWCELYAENGVGQVENVSTTKVSQGRGVARSVIARAVEASVRAGSSLNFLVADDDDWPKELYARMGYQPVAYTYEFLLKPPGSKVIV